MKLPLYKFYILKSYLKYFLLTTFIFFSLSFILNILQEITFLKEYNVMFQNEPIKVYEVLF